MGLIQYYQTTSQPVNQAICIFITVPTVFCNLVAIKCINIIIIIIYLHCICIQEGLPEFMSILKIN